MAKKKCTCCKSSEGLAFLAFFFIGWALSGPLLGVGLGFLAMLILRYKR